MTTTESPQIIVTAERDDHRRTTTFEAWERIDNPARPAGRHCHSMCRDGVEYGRIASVQGMDAATRAVEETVAALAIVAEHPEAIDGIRTGGIIRLED